MNGRIGGEDTSSICFDAGEFGMNLINDVTNRSIVVVLVVVVVVFLIHRCDDRRWAPKSGRKKNLSRDWIKRVIIVVIIVIESVLIFIFNQKSVFWLKIAIVSDFFSVDEPRRNRIVFQSKWPIELDVGWYIHI